MANAKALAKQLPGYFTVAEAAELPEDNVFTIAAAGMKSVGQGAQAEDKPVLSFTETKKSLVLNKGRCNQLSSLFGDDDLVAKTIRLGVETIKGLAQIVIVSPE